MKKIIAITAATILWAGAAVAAEPNAASLATGVCSACHGPGGISISPVFPNLAGQQAAYIMLQLDAFRSHQRGDPNAQAYMWGMASQLSDDTIQALANYYAAQKPAKIPPGNNAALLAEGKQIYTQGIKAENVPACASCHGANAEGAAAFPRLAGQHIDYLVAQLKGFKSGLRANAPIMLGVTKTMSTEEMTAVATYAASR
jgi:cytochrome c553